MSSEGIIWRQRTWREEECEVEKRSHPLSFLPWHRRLSSRAVKLDQCYSVDESRLSEKKNSMGIWTRHPESSKVFFAISETKYWINLEHLPDSRLLELSCAIQRILRTLNVLAKAVGFRLGMSDEPAWHFRWRDKRIFTNRPNKRTETPIRRFLYWLTSYQ